MIKTSKKRCMHVFLRFLEVRPDYFLVFFKVLVQFSKRVGRNILNKDGTLLEMSYEHCEAARAPRASFSFK